MRNPARIRPPKPVTSQDNGLDSQAGSNLREFDSVIFIRQKIIVVGSGQVLEDLPVFHGRKERLGRIMIRVITVNVYCNLEYLIKLSYEIKVSQVKPHIKFQLVVAGFHILT